MVTRRLCPLGACDGSSVGQRNAAQADACSARGRNATGHRLGSGVPRGEIRNSAGDPGVVLARRLSNAEYNYTIRDLTGQDMQLTRQFPVDPANQAGFDNSGESLTMSPGAAE